MSTRIVVRESQKLPRPAAFVFGFVSDGANDHLWRRHVSRVRMSGRCAVGVEWRESATTLPFLTVVTPFTIAELEPGRRLVLETPPSHLPYRRVQRTVVAMGDGRSILICERMIETSLPPWLASLWEKRRIRRDLRALRKLMAE